MQDDPLAHHSWTEPPAISLIFVVLGRSSEREEIAYAVGVGAYV